VNNVWISGSCLYLVWLTGDASLAVPAENICRLLVLWKPRWEVW